MENTNIFTNIKTEYTNLAKEIEKAYNIMAKSPNFNLVKSEVLTSFDNFIQSVLLKTIINMNPVTIEQYNFVKNLGKFTDYFKDYTFFNDKDLSKDVINKLEEKCNKCLTIVPSFIVMSIMIDKELEESIDQNKITFSAHLYVSLKKLTEMLLVSESAEKKVNLEKQVIYGMFRPIRHFLRDHHIIFL